MNNDSESWVFKLWRDVGVCVPFPVKQIKANNVIDNIIQNIYNMNEMMKWLFTMMTMNNGKNGHNQTRRYV